MLKGKDIEKKINKIMRRGNSKCIIKNCTEKSIYSHIISKSISIDKISKNNHLTIFSPSRYGETKIPKLIYAGVNEYPAFNGFCKNHDSMFELIDNSEIENFLGLYLQIYRTISSQAYYLKIGPILYPDLEYKHSSTTDEDKSKDLFNELIDQANKNKNTKFNNQIKSFDKLQEYFLNEIEKNKDELNRMEIKKNKLHVLWIEELKYSIFVYLTDFQIPVAISTLHTIPCASDSEDESYSFYIVVPYENSNAIIGVIGYTADCIVLRKIIDMVDMYFTDADPFSVLNFIESLVMSSSDNIFFSPEVIDKMSTEKLQIFKDDCMFLNEFCSSDKYLSEYDLSIFDDVRSQLIDKAFINKESELIKLTNIPIRDDYDKRMEKLNAKMIKQGTRYYK